MPERDVFLQKRIFNWSEKLPPWQRGLMRLLCDGPLDDEARARVLAALLGEPGAPGLPLLQPADLPADEGAYGTVELREIRNLQNINSLAGDQALGFGPGLNVVFGENGAGKSGYGRLARRVCRAAEPGEVLHDVFDPGRAESPQTAEFVIAVDGEERVVEVDLAAEAPRVLSAITAFDAGCADFCISRSNTIEHTPRPLRLLKELVEAQGELAEELAEQIDELRDGLPELPELDDPEAAALLARVEAGEAAREEAEAFARLGEEELAELRELEQAEATIASDRSRELEAAARKRATAVERLAAELEAAWKLLDDEALEEIGELRTRLARASAAVDQVAAEAFADQPQPGTGGETWREMWEAARRFVEIGGGAFPNEAGDATCPLCQQDLEAAARERMRRFEAFVSGNLREQVRLVDAALTEHLERLPDLGEIAHAAEVAVAAAGEHLQEPADAALAAVADRLAIVTGRSEPSLLDGGLDLKPLRDYVAVQVAEAEGFAVLRNEGERARVEARLRELRARQAVAAARADVLAYMESLEAVAVREQARAALSTGSISHRIRELSRLAITDRLKEALEQEIGELDPIASRVELKASASKGKPAVQFRLRAEGREKVGKVLSTGEQTALATAFFLAELRVSNDRSAIILDDPVSSLDHQRREHVAARLVEEAARRQVVVFTHDLVFVAYLLESAEALGLDLHAQTLVRADGEVGVVSSDLPWQARSPMERLRALRHELKTELRPLYKGRDSRYERRAQQWLLDLRRGYERLIEIYLLNGVIERQALPIRVQKLHGIRWTPELAEEIDIAMREVSGSAHQEPLGRQGPSLTRLEALLDRFQELCERTKPGSARVEEEASAQAPVPLRFR